jgi:hypothetical protein
VLLGVSEEGTKLDDPDLAALVVSWPALPAVIRAGILAMVRASAGEVRS